MEGRREKRRGREEDKNQPGLSAMTKLAAIAINMALLRGRDGTAE